MNRYIILFILLYACIRVEAQILSEMDLSYEKGLFIKAFGTGTGRKIISSEKTDLFSFRLNGRIVHTSEADVTATAQQYRLKCPDYAEVIITVKNIPSGTGYTLEFINHGPDTIALENVVPFGENPGHIFITADGPPALARAKLFRPGKIPVGIILPDNAWELGYGSFRPDTGISVCALARRISAQGSVRRRYQTVMPPGGSAVYELMADGFKGKWQEGLTLMFRDRYLYDLDMFDNGLYERQDLNWIRDVYIISLMFAWDHTFYDPNAGGYRIGAYMDQGNSLMGGYDVIGVWPTWPRLGVDQRNQWDMYRDLPGSLPALRSLSDQMHAWGIRFFIAYNPWDNSTRTEDHMSGLSAILEATDADGVVLDTRGNSSTALQEAADRVKKGVVMYSEGMAVTADMPGIIAGRVHNAIVQQPLLNMNRIIKPDFSIFRVCDINEDRLHREIAVSFFNGTGTELISFAPGRPDWLEEEFDYLGKTTMILRANSSLFKNSQWIPLTDTRCDSIWVNEWFSADKKIFTVFSLIPEGYAGPLIPCEPVAGRHYISLWHHRELMPEYLDSAWYLPVFTESFHHTWLGTRQEGTVDCVAEFNCLLEADRTGDSIFICADKGDRIIIWKGNPSYQNSNHQLLPGVHHLKLSDLFGAYEGTVVVQLFDGSEILDERILGHKPGIPWLVSTIVRTDAGSNIPGDMVLIPGAEIIMGPNNPDQFIPYPEYDQVPVTVLPFLMDIYPVTNKQFNDFIEDSGYKPPDTTNFLKHWKGGSYKPGEADLPVVYVDLEDAKAYARWAGKRLPAEAEWQLAARGTDDRLWPWGNQLKKERYNHLGRLTPVTAFPAGSSPYGVRDLVGNVWQLTGDVYENGSYTFVMIRGGSYFNPSSSIWYVRGGPQPLDCTQMLLMMSPGFNRCATVGFRCVRDIRQQ